MNTNEVRKKQPFLRKGQGTARFKMKQPEPSFPRTSLTEDADEDTVSAAPASSAPNSDYAKENICSDVVRTPMFNDSGAGSTYVSTNWSGLSEEQRGLRAMAHEMGILVNRMNKSTTECASSLSTPLGASTPIDHKVENERNVVPNRLFKSKNENNENINKKENNERLSKENRILKHLVIQLRDAIAHIDFSEEQLKKTAKNLNENYTNLCKKLQTSYELKNMELEKDYRRKVDELANEKRIDEEKTRRIQGHLERERRLFDKDSGDLNKMIDDQRKKLCDLETQLAKYRQEIRKKDEKIKSQEEIMAKKDVTIERSKKSCQILEKRIRQMRFEKNKEKQEDELHANAAELIRKKSAPVQPRCVSWADKRNTSPSQTIKLPVSKTPEDGILIPYENGDKRWVSNRHAFHWYYYASDGSIQMNLILADIMIRFFPGIQLEIIRPKLNYSLISFKRQQLRTESILRDDSLYEAQIFDINGGVLLKNKISRDSYQRYPMNSKCSFRDNKTRYVHTYEVDDFEYIEPEFRLRYYKGQSIACKIINSSIDCTLKVSMDIENGSGVIEAVDKNISTGINKRRTIIDWR